jgi:membrane protein implicated in regulation of membrane protease activity
MEDFAVELYWYWLAAGVLLILAELAVPGFVICFFGVSALAAGVVNFFFPGFPLIGQLLLFAVGGAVLALSCRKLAPGIFAGKESRSDKDIDSDDVAGEVCVCCEKISDGIAGKVEFRGSFWNAVSDEKIAVGERAIISNARQNAAVARALEAIESAISSLDSGFYQDAVSCDTERALGELSELDGHKITEEILHDIFSKFCVGK